MVFYLNKRVFLKVTGKTKPENIRASTGLEPVTFEMPVRCSSNWAMKPHIGSEVNLLSSYLPWGVNSCEAYMKLLFIQNISPFLIGWNHTLIIGHVRYINILTWLRGFQVKPLYLVLFSLYLSLFWELRDKGNLKNLQFWPESLAATLEYWMIYRTWPIHHNQLLFSKFGKNLCHIESLTSKVQPSADYWTDDVKMTSKVQPAADYWTINQKNLGMRLCYLWWAEKQRAEWRNSFTNGEVFKWIIKQLLNSAFVGRKEFCRSRGVLSTSAFGLCG